MPRIVTYNVHRCVGADRKLDVGRIASVIDALEPDIVALQELDVGRARSGGVDQAHEIAQRLEMTHHFNAALTVEEEQYGDAILTSLPEKLVKAGALPGLATKFQVEPRGALWIAVEIGGRWVQVINAHLGLVPREQQRQARTLAGEAWLERARAEGPVILLGDFNATRASVVYRTLTRGLQDARQTAATRRASTTFPSAFPVLRIDHIFVSPEIKAMRIEAPYDRTMRLASDHLPLVMDFEVEP